MLKLSLDKVLSESLSYLVSAKQPPILVNQSFPSLFHCFDYEPDADSQLDEDTIRASRFYSPKESYPGINLLVFEILEDAPLGLEEHCVLVAVQFIVFLESRPHAAFFVPEHLVVCLRLRNCLARGIRGGASVWR